MVNSAPSFVELHTVYSVQDTVQNRRVIWCQDCDFIAVLNAETMERVWKRNGNLEATHAGGMFGVRLDVKAKSDPG